MTINSTGPISLGGSNSGQSINLEIGKTGSQQVSMADFLVSGLGGKEAGSQVSFADLRSKSVFRASAYESITDRINDDLMFWTSSDTAHYLLIFADNSSPTYGWTVHIVKTALNGEIIWSKVYRAASLKFRPTAIRYHQGTNSLYVGGYFFDDASGFVMKLNPSTGAVVWITRITVPAGSIWQWIFQLDFDSSNNIYFSARCQVTYDAVSIGKLDSSGNLLWNKVLRAASGTSGVLNWGSFYVDQSGNTYISVYNNVLSTNTAYQYAVVKLTSTGTLVWQTAFGSKTTINAVRETSSGDIRCFGTGNPTFPSYVYYMGSILLNASTGAVISQTWHEDDPVDLNPDLITVHTSSSGDYYVLAIGNPNAAPVYNSLYVYRLNSSAVIQWATRIDMPFSDSPPWVNYDYPNHITNNILTIPTSRFDTYLSSEIFTFQVDAQTTQNIGGFKIYSVTTPAVTATFTAPSLAANMTLSNHASSTTTAPSITVEDVSVRTQHAYFGAKRHWVARLGTASTEYGYCLAVNEHAEIYIGGQTSINSGQPYVAKLSLDGQIIWQREVVVSGRVVSSVTFDAAGNCYALSDYINGSYSDLIIYKYNSSGTLVWQRGLGTLNDLQFAGQNSGRITVDKLQNPIVVGYNYVLSASAGDALLVKYDPNGNILWQRLLGGTLDDTGATVAVDRSNNIYVFGHSRSYTTGNADFWITKYNSGGTLQWSRTLGVAANSEFGVAADVDSSDNIYVTGITYSQGQGGGDVLLAKYSPAGTLLWQRLYGGSAIDGANGIAIDFSSNVYIAGTTQSAGAGGADIFVAKYDTNGTLLWQRTLGAANTEGIFDGISVDNVDSYCICFSIDGDAMIARLPADGSKTGTYGSLIYQAVSLTSATASMSDVARTITSSASSLVSTTTTFTSSAASLPITVTYV